MIRHAVPGLAALFLIVGTASAADKEVKGTVVKVDLKQSTLVVKTEDGEKTYDVNDQTKFLGPKGGVSDAGLKDDRLAPGTEITLLIAGNNRTAHEVRMPERKKPIKDK
jgi:FlaG/FlaF family flagellin (archaellin)